MATAPGEELLRAPPCEELDPATFFSLFHCELRVIIYKSHGKLHLFLGKSTKTASTRAALLTPICTKSFVGQSPRPHWGSLDRSPDPLAVFRGLLLNRGEEERSGGEGREFVRCHRKKKEMSAPVRAI